LDTGKSTGQRPQLIGDPNSGPRRPEQFFNNTALYVPNPAVASERTFGSIGRNTLEGPNYKSVDFSLLKHIPIAERLRAQFRAELLYADRYRIYFAPGAYRVDTIEGLSLIAHEVAHCLQYHTHGAWRFRARYLAAYFKNRLRGMNHLRAYRSIPFEIEAREVEEQVYRALKTLQSDLA